MNIDDIQHELERLKGLYTAQQRLDEAAVASALGLVDDISTSLQRLHQQLFPADYLINEAVLSHARQGVTDLMQRAERANTLQEYESLRSEAERRMQAMRPFVDIVQGYRIIYDLASLRLTRLADEGAAQDDDDSGR